MLSLIFICSLNKSIFLSPLLSRVQSIFTRGNIVNTLVVLWIRSRRIGWYQTGSVAFGVRLWSLFESWKNNAIYNTMELTDANRNEPIPIIPTFQGIFCLTYSNECRSYSLFFCSESQSVVQKLKKTSQKREQNRQLWYHSISIDWIYSN